MTRRRICAGVRFLIMIVDPPEPRIAENQIALNTVFVGRLPSKRLTRRSPTGRCTRAGCQPALLRAPCPGRHPKVIAAQSAGASAGKYQCPAIERKMWRDIAKTRVHRYSGVLRGFPGVVDTLACGRPN